MIRLLTGVTTDRDLHTLEVYAWWLEYYFRRAELKGVTSQLSEKRFGAFKSVSQIRALDRKIDAVAKSVVAELGPKDLDRKRWDKYRGKRTAITPREVIWHMIEEDFLHRGKIICMLWQDDSEPPHTHVWWWEYDSDPEGHQDLWYRYPDVPRGSPGGYVSAKVTPTPRKRGTGHHRALVTRTCEISLSTPTFQCVRVCNVCCFYFTKRPL
jgi:uncharacterized damage-inducible protein DinB